MTPIKYSEIKLEAEKHGLKLMSCLTRERVEARLGTEVPRLIQWQELGYPGEMSYMKRSDSLICDPSNLLANYNSILTFLVPYSSANINKQINCPTGYGKVARYAQGLDYHEVLRRKLREFVTTLNLENNVDFKVFSDSVPTLERALANQGGLGFIGKSTMLISPNLGTYTFICELIWSLEVAEVPEAPSIKSRCGTCIQCKSDCPTNAIVDDRKVDARKCISYLTIEKRDVFTPEEVHNLGNWVFGCDICQEVCPHNLNKKNDELIPNELRSSAGVGPLLNLREILQLNTTEEFQERFKATAILRTKRQGLIRNSLAVASNQKAYDLIPQIEHIARSDMDLNLKACASSVLNTLVR